MPLRAVESLPVTIAGPVGNLEALVEAPHATASDVAVVCHPHPLQQGSMTNKVVYTVSRCFARAGAVALRFNFRGVGRSEGAHAGGEGEVDDAVAVASWARERWPGTRVHLGGFSFGAAVALRAAPVVGARSLVTVAPPVRRLPTRISHPGCPWLLVQGADDDVVPAADVPEFAARFDPPPEVRVIPGAGHLFHGRLKALGAAVTEFCARTVGG